jgi:CheY-like chemotaxis protein
MLKNLGYQVFEAEDGEAALAVLKAKNGIDLLLADVVLSGGISGPCLVDEAKRDRPDLKIIYMSGHIDKVAESGHSPCQADAVFEKPFRKCDLAQKVRAVLDGSRASSDLTGSFDRVLLSRG